MKIPVLILMCMIVIAPVHAQSPVNKPGKAQENDFSFSVCPIDSSAEAFYIYDYADVSFSYDVNNGWYWLMRRHFKIKIVNTEGYDYANISLKLYEDNTEEENVYGIKGYTYNLENGKIDRIKLDKDNINKEELSEHMDEVKISMPAVKEGSVIELAYNLKSTVWTQLRDWNFQHDIPVLYSEYLLGIPEYFDYSINMKGYEILDLNESTTSTGTIYLQGDHLRFNQNNRHMIATNLPALRDEKYVDNMDNYRSSLEFELRSINYPWDMAHNYSTSWNAVTDYLNDHSAFGDKLNRDRFARKDVDQIMKENPDPEKRMLAIYDHVKSSIKCDGKYGMYSSTPLREVYNKGMGCCKDINFILINLLRAAEIQAYPVALSTRKNGIIFPTFPTVDKFNYVVALAMIDDKPVFLDASNSYCSPGILPSFCLNGRGRIIDKNINRWVDLPANLPYSETTSYDLILDPNGNMTGKITYKKEGYAAMAFREWHNDLVNEDKMVEELSGKRPGININSWEFEGLEKRHGKVVATLDVEINDGTDLMGDMISFMPMLYETTDENPFRLEERKFPVDFNYPRNSVMSFKFTLPEGYEVESIPENTMMVTPDKSAKFIYSMQNFGNVVNLTVITEINKVLYLPSEYKNIQQFFNLMVAKQAEQIIIKKV